MRAHSVALEFFIFILVAVVAILLQWQRATTTSSISNREATQQSDIASLFEHKKKKVKWGKCCFEY